MCQMSEGRRQVCRLNFMSWRRVQTGFQKLAVTKTPLSLINQKMRAIEISADNFFNHVDKFYKTWTNTFSKEYDCVLIVSGKADETNPHIEAALGWFFGYSLTPTVLLFSKKSIVIYTSENKIKVLQPIADHQKAKGLQIIFLKREKQAEANIPSHQRMLEALEESTRTPKIGVIHRSKDAPLDDFEVFIKDKSYKYEDCLPLLNQCLVIKDLAEAQFMLKSALITCYFFHKLVDNILQIIDDEQSVPHSQISGKMESMLESDHELRKAQANLSAQGIKKDLIDNICNGPAIQSGGNFVMKLLPEPDKENLKVGCVLVGFGCKYQMYNTFVTRTLLIGKSDNYETTYGKILQLHKFLISLIEPGKKIKQVYKKAVEYIKAELPDVEIPSNFGSGIGLEFRENLLIINDTNERNFEPNMTLLVTCGFKGLKIANSSNTFAVQLSDVVLINEKGPCSVLTQNDNTKKAFRKVFWEFGDVDDKKKEPRKQNKKKVQEAIIEGPGRGTRKRNQKKPMAATNYKERNDHQMELKKQKQEELKQRLNQTFSGSLKKIKEVDSDKVECYKNREEFPKDVKKNKIYVDVKNNALLLPINGVMVPFNINILKNIVKYEEGKFVALRFNFHTPISGLIGNINPPKLEENTVFVKELTYRSENTKSLTEVFKNVKQLQRKIKNMADQQKNKEQIVDQQKLQINKSKKPLLRDLGIRPNLMNKKAKGSLQCHFNGFRYTAQKGQIIDVIFTNIKNAFIQPPEESIAAIHFRLHHPIMVGKKKSEDVQFYAEVGGIAEDVERYRRGDDDSDDEELIRAARKKLEKELMEFAKACEEYSKDAFEWEVPIKDLGFTGTPYKATSLLVPTAHCLINLTEQPFFVLNLDQVQIAWFERMFANLSTFDLTFVYKDFERFIRVQAIPIFQVQKIKNWLDKSGIIFCDIKRIFDWSKFLAPIRNDFKSFVDDGGWMAWDSDSEEGEEGDSEFTPSVSEYEETSQSSESSEYEEEQDSDQYDGEEDLSESGLSESEMERRFEEDDRKKIKKELEKQKGSKQKRK